MSSRLFSVCSSFSSLKTCAIIHRIFKDRQNCYEHCQTFQAFPIEQNFFFCNYCLKVSCLLWSTLFIQEFGKLIVQSNFSLLKQILFNPFYFLIFHRLHFQRNPAGPVCRLDRRHSSLPGKTRATGCCQESNDDC